MELENTNCEVAMRGQLLRALDERYWNTVTNRQHWHPVGSRKLSPRQIQVLRLMLDGMSSREIARILCIAPKTVASHREGICSRVGTGNPYLLARWAIREKIIEA